jgi:predicted DNA-binding transcriptional regulator AlpA
MTYNDKPRMPSGDAAEYIGIAGSTLAKWRMNGRGPKFVKAGSRVLYDRADLDEWLGSRKRLHTAQARG